MYFLPPEEGQASKKGACARLGTGGRELPKRSLTKYTNPAGCGKVITWTLRNREGVTERTAFPVTDFRQAGDVGWR